ncbi:SMAD/FHA domain-containing protein [Amanita rubescens]|nr:SMAD/FHA domain-containing protein [Amanita rubescens]
MHPDSNRNTIFRIQLTPYLDSPNPFQFDAITRDLLESGTILQIGRFTDRGGLSSSEINALGTDRLVFKSKVVSRKHAQIWVGNGGKFFIKDTKSSGGTFLNNRRLSLANQESIPFQLNDGDILQLGVDYRDGTDDFCKNVKIRVALWTVREVDASQVTVDRHHALLRTPVSASPTFQESGSE